MSLASTDPKDHKTLLLNNLTEICDYFDSPPSVAVRGDMKFSLEEVAAWQLPWSDPSGVKDLTKNLLEIHGKVPLKDSPAEAVPPFVLFFLRTEDMFHLGKPFHHVDHSQGNNSQSSSFFSIVLVPTDMAENYQHFKPEDFCRAIAAATFKWSEEGNRKLVNFLSGEVADSYRRKGVMSFLLDVIFNLCFVHFRPKRVRYGNSTSQLLESQDLAVLAPVAMVATLPHRPGDGKSSTPLFLEASGFRACPSENQNLVSYTRLGKCTPLFFLCVCLERILY